MPFFMPLFDNPDYSMLMTDMRIWSLKLSSLITGRLWVVRCDLSLANFSNAFFQTVKFENCQLEHADFTGATLYNVIFENCNLVGAKFDIAAYDAATRESLLNGNNQLHKDVRFYLQCLGPSVDPTEVGEDEDAEG